VVADKPHFLPVIPAGRFVRERLVTVIAMQPRPHAAASESTRHGGLMFSACPATRGLYQTLFRDRQVAALRPRAGLRPGLSARAGRLASGTPFFRMREVDGVPNARTRIEVLESDSATHWRYRLTPFTGKKHQLRVHMAALGAAITNDPFYPELQDERDDDHGAPLKLLARGLAFADGQRRATAFHMHDERL
jgi:tRNA pseudouridine32 synthase/23S rRNA pseudouridine746 synthase